MTGGSGLVGSAVRTVSGDFPEYEFVFASSSMYDLRDFDASLQMIGDVRPDIVIHLAARVGGLFLNMNDKVNLFEENIRINMNVLRAAHAYNVRRVISCLSTCIFPDKTTYPIHEDMLHMGPPHSSNDAYAYAKRMLEVQSRAYREQYGYEYTCIIPTNVYGPCDNFDLHDAHVIPALIHRCFISKQSGKPFIVAGSGKPLRQFIHSHDLARLIITTISCGKATPNMILSVDPQDEVSIRSVAMMIADAFDYSDNVLFDITQADGQYRKTADNTLLREILPEYTFIPLSTGIKSTVEWFTKTFPNIRTKKLLNETSPVYTS